VSVRILYFASLRETLGCSEELLAQLPDGVETAGALRNWLCLRGDAWRALEAGRSVRVAVNQSIASGDAVLTDGDEIAFFPPVTGG
jgi:molybdopterin synthase sulfur carrier subunit